MRPISTVGSPFVSFVQVWPPFVDLYKPLSGPAANQLSDRATPLIRRGVQHVGILRIHRDVGDAGVGLIESTGFPRLTAVSGLVEAAIAARTTTAVRSR